MKQAATTRVHSSGYGDIHLIHSSDSVIMATSGEDGKVRFTDAKSNDKRGQIQMKDMVSAFAVTPDEKHVIACCLEDNTVYQFSYPECAMEKMVLRSTVSIFHLAVSSNYIVVASEDPVTRVLSVQSFDNTDADEPVIPEIKLKGHDGSVNSVALSKDDQFVATACVSEGIVMVFSVPDGKRVWSTDAIDTSVRFDDDMLCRPDWDPTGKYLAVPGQKEIELREYGTFTLAGRLHHATNGHSEPVNAVSWSPNGLYLASSCLGKQLRIWDVERRECIESYQFDYILTGMEWSKTENSLAILNVGGACAYITPIIPERMTAPFGMPQVPQQEQRQESNSRFILNEVEESNDNTISVSDIKNQYGFGDGEDLDMIDDEDDEQSLGGRADTEPVAVVIRETDRQAAFQPGSATEENIHILAWTPTGEIQSIPSGDYNLVKVEFSNKSRRMVKFQDQYFFTMAALSENGAVFAAKASNDNQDDDLSLDDAIPSVVFYRAFDAWSTRVTWSIPLPTNENAMAVAAGDDWVAVATSTNLIRVYNAVSGTVKCIVHAPGSVVAMTAHLSYLAITYHLPGGEKMHQDSQPIGYTMYYVELSSMEHMSSGRVPLQPHTTMSWFGFSDVGMLFVSDSSGLIQALHIAMGWQWSPAVIKSNIKGLSNPMECCRVWCVGIVRDQLLHFALPPGKLTPTLRGKKRPVPSTLSLKTAAASSGETPFSWSAKVLQHERHVVLFQHERQRKQKELLEISLSHEFMAPQAALDKEILQLIKKACADEKPEKAYDLARTLSLEKSYSIAIKIATHFNEQELSDRLQDMQEQRFALDNDEEEVINDLLHGNNSMELETPKKYLTTQRNSNNIYALPSNDDDDMEAEQQHPSQASLFDENQSPPLNTAPVMPNPFAAKHPSVEPKRKNVTQLLEEMKSPIKLQRR